MASEAERFAEWVNRRYGAGTVESLRILFNNKWSSSSNSTGAGAMKYWAHERFGVDIRHHGRIQGEAALRDAVRADMERVAKASGKSVPAIMEMLDAEYAFHQWYLRRFHGWDAITVDRGMAREEASKGFNRRTGIFTPNALASTTTSPEVFKHQPARIRMQARVEDFLKTWYQGRSFMKYQEDEVEYIIIGRPQKAKRVK